MAPFSLSSYSFLAALAHQWIKEIWVVFDTWESSSSIASCNSFLSAPHSHNRRVFGSRARWFQLFVMDSFGEPSYSAGYREKHFGLYGFGVGGLLYPAQALPMWQNFFQRVQKQVLGFPAAYIWSDACHIHQNLLSYQEKHYGWDG